MKKKLIKVQLLCLGLTPCCTFAADIFFSQPVLDQTIINRKAEGIDGRIRFTPGLGFERGAEFDLKKPWKGFVQSERALVFMEGIAAFDIWRVVGFVQVGGGERKVCLSADKKASKTSLYLNPLLGVRYLSENQCWMGGFHGGLTCATALGRVQGHVGFEGRNQYITLRLAGYFPLPKYWNGTSVDPASVRFANFGELSGAFKIPGFPYVSIEGTYTGFTTDPNNWAIAKPGMSDQSIKALAATLDQVQSPSDGYIGVLIRPIPLLHVRLGWQVSARALSTALSFSYRLDMPFYQQLRSARVKYVNTVPGSRLDFVERRNGLLFIQPKPLQKSRMMVDFLEGKIESAESAEKEARNTFSGAQDDLRTFRADSAGVRASLDEYHRRTASARASLNRLAALDPKLLDAIADFNGSLSTLCTQAQWDTAATEFKEKLNPYLKPEIEVKQPGTSAFVRAVIDSLPAVNSIREPLFEVSQTDRARILRTTKNLDEKSQRIKGSLLVLAADDAEAAYSTAAEVVLTLKKKREEEKRNLESLECRNRLRKDKE